MSVKKQKNNIGVILLGLLVVFGSIYLFLSAQNPAGSSVDVNFVNEEKKGVKRVEKIKDPSVKVKNTTAVAPITDPVVTPVPAVTPPPMVITPAPSQFVFVINVEDYAPFKGNFVFSGAAQRGTLSSNAAKRFYLLDKNYQLLDIVPVKAVTQRFDKYIVAMDQSFDPSDVAFMAETAYLKSQNLKAGNIEPKGGQSIMIITDADESPTAQNREMIVNVKRGSLSKNEILYAYDENLNLLNEAEIIYLLTPEKSAVESLPATDGVELVLEFENEFSTAIKYLTPLQSKAILKDYLMVMNL